MAWNDILAWWQQRQMAKPPGQSTSQILTGAGNALMSQGGINQGQADMLSGISSLFKSQAPKASGSSYLPGATAEIFGMGSQGQSIPNSSIPQGTQMAMGLEGAGGMSAAGMMSGIGGALMGQSQKSKDKVAQQQDVPTGPIASGGARGRGYTPSPTQQSDWHMGNSGIANNRQASLDFLQMLAMMEQRARGF